METPRKQDKAHLKNTCRKRNITGNNEALFQYFFK